MTASLTDAPISAAEQQLERERAQIVEAMDWIDAERKRLSRFCFAETRKKWHGDRQRSKSITLAKKQDEWLYRQRCALRTRIGDINSVLKDARRARSGAVSANFGTVFVEVARQQLPEDVFKAIAEKATIEYGHGLESSSAAPHATTGHTVLQKLRSDLEAFKASNEPVPFETQVDRETQSDFLLGRRTDDNRIYPAFAS